MKKIVLIVLLAMTAILSVSCCAEKKIEKDDHEREVIERIVEVERIDSVYVDHFIEKEVKGDTVFVTVTDYKYKLQVRNDTVHSVDTVEVTKTEYVETASEKKVYVWWPVIVLVPAILIGVYLLKRRLKK